MAVFTISDLHLSVGCPNKSMDVFGARWIGYAEKLTTNWKKVVGPDDTVIIPGDISWGMTLEDAVPDLRFLDSLPGRKIIGKGNHDFWWSSGVKMKNVFEREKIGSISFLHNNALRVEGRVICGTRGWFPDEKQQKVVGDADYRKIVAREVIRLELSLKAAEELADPDEPTPPLVFLHFPPTWNGQTCPEILSCLQSHRIQTCYFGHIHGQYNQPGAQTAGGIRMVLVSADFLQFNPIPVI